MSKSFRASAVGCPHLRAGGIAIVPTEGPLYPHDRDSSTSRLRRFARNDMVFIRPLVVPQRARALRLARRSSDALGSG
jgi:hypothetical protein